MQTDKPTNRSPTFYRGNPSSLEPTDTSPDLVEEIEETFPSVLLKYTQTKVANGIGAL